MLKRRVSEVTKAVPSASPRRRRKTREPRADVVQCPKDDIGPRIPTLLKEFGKHSPVTEHMEWLHNLELSCENQGCCVTGCAAGSPRRGRSIEFAKAHGAKTLMNGMNMFITYHIPRFYGIRSDDEWRRALAALRSFHMFCVRRRYVRDDAGLMRALHRLKGFPMHTIPSSIKELVEDRYWDGVEKRRRVQALAEGVAQHGVDEDKYDVIIRDETAVVVEEIDDGGWVLVSEGENDLADKAYLQLPAEVAVLGVKGMSISCVMFGLKGGVWRPFSGDGGGIEPIVYPPDEAFY
eukprot:GFKZ01013028.1.p1 GENE.GFKZ01013028.1~~GFKZ01013028.1.p1  ORF type:complete len:293 (+),score=37.61 GFKZ01013028.1:326-1204(+)